jgi:hypothetical protein
LVKKDGKGKKLLGFFKNIFVVFKAFLKNEIFSNFKISLELIFKFFKIIYLSQHSPP